MHISLKLASGHGTVHLDWAGLCMHASNSVSRVLLSLSMISSHSDTSMSMPTCNCLYDAYAYDAYAYAYGRAFIAQVDLIVLVAIRRVPRLGSQKRRVTNAYAYA